MVNAMLRELQWGQTEELLATLVEQVDQLTRVTITAYSKTNPRFGPPLKVPRPGGQAVKQPKGKGSSMTVSQLLAAMKKG